ncbi:MAG: hypothetical protein LBE06_07450 [Azoarcus sp.]|nr:hypothetical protein [Azoarcus sp.]
MLSTSSACSFWVQQAFPPEGNMLQRPIPPVSAIPASATPMNKQRLFLTHMLFIFKKLQNDKIRRHPENNGAKP